jgi:hypothetical protein
MDTCVILSTSLSYLKIFRMYYIIGRREYVISYLESLPT